MIFASVPSEHRHKEVYHAAMDACSKGGQWQQACTLLVAMESAGFEPGTRAYNLVIAACARARRWREALRLLEQMIEAGVEADVISYGTAIAACERSRNWQASPPLAAAAARPRAPEHLRLRRTSAHSAHHRSSGGAQAVPPHGAKLASSCGY